MSENLKIKYKVGEIEFEAEGTADDVEKQRETFMKFVLPAAVNAMVQTRVGNNDVKYIDMNVQQPLLGTTDIKGNLMESSLMETDLSRTNLTMFMKKFGAIGDQDFVLIAVYFDEKKNNNKIFSVENIKQYYSEARKTPYSNNSELIRQLLKKGFIMETQGPEGAKNGKFYMLTKDGINYIETFVPREEKCEKRKILTKKTTNKKSSVYSVINADDLNLSKYPSVKSLQVGKEQVVMAMYIVTNEKKGEWFTVDDVYYILINIFEVHVTEKSIRNVFDRNKSMFVKEQDENNKKALRRKLLSGAKDFAKKLMEKA